ncbi:MAG: tryptophan--tRNA ligase [Motilibacteraceae bacterium]
MTLTAETLTAETLPTQAAATTEARAITGLKPTGSAQLGNLLGAIRPVVRLQRAMTTTVFVADLHALTVEHDPAALRRRTRELATLLLAAGLDPEHTTLFVQSDVPEHLELHYLLECTTTFGEARRMVQFREKGEGREEVRLSLLTYPVLQAADVLLHDVTHVPVGDDQRQHLELARDVARRFNARYGETFVVPEPVHPPVARRLMDLQDPTAKMGKSSASQAGVIGLLDAPDVVRRKVARAVTDSRSEVRYDPERQPGVANLLEILAACSEGDPAYLAAQLDSYAELKDAVAETVVAVLAPLQERYAGLAADPAVLDDVLAQGRDRARERAAATLRRARAAIGLRA